MKLSLFVHMERPWSDDRQPSYRQAYDDFLELCLLADQGRMAKVWTGEHHGMDFTIAPNPFLNLVDLARRTQHVRLGTSTLNAALWHPIKVAGEAAMSDLLMDGRLELGLSRGAYSFEYERFDASLEAWQAGQRLREIVRCLRGLWAGDFEHEGEFWQFPKTTCIPKPTRPEGPPVWIAARDPNSHEFAVEQGCNVKVTPLWKGVAEVQDLMGKFQAAKAKFPDQTPKILLLHHVYVAKDEADARRAAQTLHQWYTTFGAWFQNKRPVDQGQIAPLTDSDYAINPLGSVDDILEHQVIGTANQVQDRLALYKEMGFDEFAYWSDNGLSHADKMGSLERFIEQVAPALA